ncbi:MAG: ATP-dependent helicase HrpB, partial [Candidatus Azotimanducaceae bacterium]
MPNPIPTPNLPVNEILDELKLTLSKNHQAILQAPPGAGKTTLVPLALACESWLGRKKIIMLEPRRIATRAAAVRMAELLGESVGQTVGYRMRLDRKVSKHTKIEVITEGILTRMLQDDPSLEDVGLVIFDEFHERSLDADLALALCLKGREMFRDEDPLKILVMSATLDDARISELLAAPLIQSQGKQYPVDIVYGKASAPRDSIIDKVVSTTLQAIGDNPDSSILVFLPGQGEIRRVEEGLLLEIGQRRVSNIHVCPLYGGLPFEAQQAAIAPLSGAGERKVVLATNIAETSLTIEGVDVVIDSGLAREPVFDPSTSMTRLHTRKISQSSSIQRAGRAGRLRPGKCYRLWSKSQQGEMAQHASPEILSADLAPVALQLMQWGISRPEELRWLDPPAPGPWSQALDLLLRLDALTSNGEDFQLTDHGHQIAKLALHPRLSHMLICGHAVGYAETACLIAGMLGDRDPFGQDSPDIADRIDILQGHSKCPNRYQGWRRRTLQMSQQFETQLNRLNVKVDAIPIDRDQVVGYLIACAYPDRIARGRHSGGYQLANGRGVNIVGQSRLEKSRWLAVAEVGGMARSKGDAIRLAAPLDALLFESQLASQVEERTVVEWDKKDKRFVAEKRRLVGELVLDRERLSTVPAEAKQETLIQHIQNSGLETLPFTSAVRQWQARVELVRSLTPGESWPNVSNDHLLSTLAAWLGPYLEPISLLSDFKKLDLLSIL